MHDVTKYMRDKQLYILVNEIITYTLSRVPCVCFYHKTRLY